MQCLFFYKPTNPGENIAHGAFIFHNFDLHLAPDHKKPAEPKT